MPQTRLVLDQEGDRGESFQLRPNPVVLNRHQFARWSATQVNRFNGRDANAGRQGELDRPA
ncbi:MAG TPA: hypothetical protein EYP14_12895 [Planctomycetaceae bacterium]|nr:hypothetical protein [Planctomycetaceae bacterium]